MKSDTRITIEVRVKWMSIFKATVAKWFCRDYYNAISEYLKAETELAKIKARLVASNLEIKR